VPSAAKRDLGFATTPASPMDLQRRAIPPPSSRNPPGDNMPATDDSGSVIDLATRNTPSLQFVCRLYVLDVLDPRTLIGAPKFAVLDEVDNLPKIRLHAALRGWI
jgi:hypothetical protein